MVFLKIKIIEIFKLYDIKVTNSDTEACHHLNIKNVSPKRVIVRFNNRKFVQKIPGNKKNEVNLEGIGFAAAFCIYFNENLCPQNKCIWMKAQMLKKDNYCMCRLTKIKHDVTSKSVKVKHFSTLFEMFANFKFESKNSSSRIFVSISL